MIHGLHVTKEHGVEAFSKRILNRISTYMRKEGKENWAINASQLQDLHFNNYC
jgi:hypothetical protein